MQHAFNGAKPKESPTFALSVSMASSVAITAVLHWIIGILKIQTLRSGLALAGVLWVLNLFLQLPHPLFEERPLQLFVIHTLYHLLCLGTACSILTVY